MKRYGNNHTAKDGYYGENIQCQPTLPKSRKESGTDLQPDGIDKQYQSEFFQEMQQASVKAKMEMSECNACKKNPGSSQRDAAYPHFAERDAQHNDQ